MELIPFYLLVSKDVREVIQSFLPTHEIWHSLCQLLCER